MASSRALGGDDLAKVVGERGDDPGLDDAVHPSPVRRERDWSILADVVLEGELAEDEKKLIAPTVEVTGINVEDGGDVVPDVADGDGLGMELQEGDGFVLEHGGAEIGGHGTSRRRITRGGLGREGCSSSRAFLGSPGQGIAGPLGSGVALLGGGGGFLFSLEGAREGRIAGLLPFLLLLGGGGGLLLGETQRVRIALERRGVGLPRVGRGRRGGSHRGAARKAGGVARQVLRGEGPARGG
jgi:hypothetical protein